MPDQPGQIRVLPVTTRRDLHHFLVLPDKIYARDPHYVPPLRSEVRKLLDRKRNPFFDHGEAGLYLAWRDAAPVGRISAQINRLHLDLHGDATGNFGFLEAVDDQAVFDGLFAAAESFLRARGMRRILGPYSPTVNDEIGVLFTGFDSAPMVMMPHSPRYYAERIERAGYRKAKDLHAYRLELRELDRAALDRIIRVSERLAPVGRISIRHLDMTQFDADMQSVLDVYNDAWSDNWGFIPITAREARHLIAQLKPLIRPEQVVLGTIDGEVVGVMVAIPNFNEIIADLGGRLLPFGWMKLLWRIWRGRMTSVRVILAGVRRSYRDSLASGAIVSVMFQALEQGGRKTGVERAEFSWILEDNKAAIAISLSGARLAKIYRLYEKGLEGPAPRPID